MSIPNDNTSPQQGSNGRYMDEQTDKRIHEHLENKDDEITEQDISNVRTDFFETAVLSSTEAIPEPENSEDAEKMQNKKIEDNDDTSIDTSWNILDA